MKSIAGYAIVIRGKYDGIYEVTMYEDRETAIQKLEERFSEDVKEFVGGIAKVYRDDDDFKQIFTADEDIITYTIEEVYNGD